MKNWDNTIMKMKAYLTERDADFLMSKAVDFAKQNQWNVSIAVVDDTGHLLKFKRLDGASPMTAKMALEKAECSAISRKPSKLFEDLIKNGQPGFLTMHSFTGMLEGAEPIIYQGELVGAIGVSGVKSCDDALIAQKAIEAFQQFLSNSP